MSNQPIRSYRDLRVYQQLYAAQIEILTQIIQSLPKAEQFDLVDQVRRSCKAAPALLAEGFAKRYQKRQWSKYLDDCIGECYETMNHLNVCVDAYSKYVNVEKCQKLISAYDQSCKQLYRLKESWTNFHAEG